MLKELPQNVILSGHTEMPPLKTLLNEVEVVAVTPRYIVSQVFLFTLVCLFFCHFFACTSSRKLSSVEEEREGSSGLNIFRKFT